MVLSELITQPDPPTHSATLLFQTYAILQTLSEDIPHYKRAKHLPDRSDYSFEYLFESASWYLLIKREDAVQDALSRGLMGTTDRAAPGAPPKSKGNKGKATDPNVPQESAPRVLPQAAERRVLGKGSRKVNQLALPTKQALAYAENAGTRTLRMTVRQKDLEKVLPQKLRVSFSYRGIASSERVQ